MDGVSPSRGLSAGVQKYLADNGFDQSGTASRAPASGEKPEWTVFINLADNVGLDNTALRLDKQLQEQSLIDSTRGKPIKIIVQTSMNDDPGYNRMGFHHVPAAYGIPEYDEPDPAPWNFIRKETSVVRYEISNGQKRLLGVDHSQGLSQDLLNLLKSDPNALKSPRVVLVNESHGLGVNGLQGDAGRMSIAQLRNSIAGALAGTGRDKLDVLDLVGCQMSNTPAVLQMGSLAKFLVASEQPEYEFWKTGEFMQPIVKPLRDLISKTDMQPQAVASKLMSRNEEDCRSNAASREKPGENPFGLSCGADTLGVYNNAALPELNTALNHLGRALLRACAQDSNKQQIQRLIESLPHVYVSPSMAKTERFNADLQHRDLGMFVSGLEAGLANGSIKDDAHGDIKAALAEMRKSMNAVVVEHFNSSQLGMGLPEALKGKYLPSDPLSGLSILLPSRPSTYTAGYGTGIRMELQAFTGAASDSIGQHMSDKQIPTADLNALVKNLSDEEKQLRQAQRSIIDKAVQRKIDGFLQAADKYRSWLNGAPALAPTERASQFAQQKTSYLGELDAITKDEHLWSAVGLAQSKKYSDELVRSESIAGQHDWNRFARFLVRQ